MTDPAPEDGTAALVVHGDASRTVGVPDLPSPQEPPRPGGTAERDAAPAPLDPAAGPGGRPAGLRGQAGRDAIKAALAEQGRRQRAQRGRYTRIADRAPGVAYKPGGNRRGGSQ